jgi:predicted nucleic acid-binding protein
MQLLVLDTNVALDLLVFRDPSAARLEVGLAGGELQWLATAAMRDELARVLGYPQVASRMARGGLTAPQVLAAFDRRAQLVEDAPPSGLACSDPDDQCFIDLAVHRRCMLLSKDAAVLVLRRRLEDLHVLVSATLPAPS